jgi:ABC-type sugar transport system ATPase subunit
MTVAEQLIEFSGISKSYKRTGILSKLDLEVPKNEFTVLFGLPGSGRSVLLRLLMGLEKPTEGRIMLRGEDVTDVPAGERNIGYVPQSFALFPNQSVYDNIGYPLKLSGADKDTIDREVHRASQMLQIEDLLAKLPNQISGGQKQRVAIARGLVKQSDVYVLDDPLAGLDFKLRERLVEDLRDLQRQLDVTFLYSTSDPTEAMSLAENVAVMAEGRIVEIGKTEQVYAEPAHRLTMEQLGFPLPNFLEATCESADGAMWAQTPLFDLEIAEPGSLTTGDRVWIGMRPEHLRVGPLPSHRSEDEAQRLAATIALREDLGAEQILYLEIGDEAMRSVARHEMDEHLKSDDVEIGVLPDECRVYHYESQDFVSVGKRIKAHG